MEHYVLLGAGFSRNWGGWLAAEAFEYLLGCPEIAAEPDLRDLLWRHQAQGGFEDALAEVQAAFIRDPQRNTAALQNMQAAVARMFADMNRAFFEITGWEFQNHQDRMVRTFLSRFDAIFTLNQDVLLEQHYTNDNIALVGAKKWHGPQLPGMKRIPSQEPMHSNSWGRSTWIPSPPEAFTIEKGSQPLYKLHGSSNWTNADGSPLLIMGGAKAREIGQSPILNWYGKLFEEALAHKSARLMVIGYGFRDQHINEAINNGAKNGLQVFVIAPEGAELAMRQNKTRLPGMIAKQTDLEALMQRSLIGASRRPLKDIFGADTAEHEKVMRFFTA